MRGGDVDLRGGAEACAGSREQWNLDSRVGVDFLHGVLGVLRNLSQRGDPHAVQLLDPLDQLLQGDGTGRSA